MRRRLQHKDLTPQGDSEFHGWQGGWQLQLGIRDSIMRAPSSEVGSRKSVKQDCMLTLYCVLQYDRTVECARAYQKKEYVHVGIPGHARLRFASSDNNGFDNANAQCQWFGCASAWCLRASLRTIFDCAPRSLVLQNHTHTIHSQRSIYMSCSTGDTRHTSHDVRPS